MDEMLEGTNGAGVRAGVGVSETAGGEHSYVVATADTSMAEDRIEQLFLRLAHALHTDIGLCKADVWARYLIKRLQDWGYL